MKTNEAAQAALPEFLEQLNEINRRIDYGEKHELAKGLFV